MKIFGFEHEIFIWESNKTKHHNLLEKIFFFFSKYMKQLNTCFSWNIHFTATLRGLKLLHALFMIWTNQNASLKHQLENPTFICQYESCSLFEWSWYMPADQMWVSHWLFHFYARWRYFVDLNKMAVEFLLALLTMKKCEVHFFSFIYRNGVPNDAFPRDYSVDSTTLER